MRKFASASLQAQVCKRKFASADSYLQKNPSTSRHQKTSPTNLQVFIFVITHNFHATAPQKISPARLPLAQPPAFRAGAAGAANASGTAASRRRGAAEARQDPPTPKGGNYHGKARLPQNTLENTFSKLAPNMCPTVSFSFQLAKNRNPKANQEANPGQKYQTLKT